MTDTNKTLSFQKGNAKLTKAVHILSLPAGHTCPSANLCRSRTDKVTGKITDGPNTQFRCFATAPEAMFPNIRKSRWNNFELLKQAKTAIGMANLIESSLLPKKDVKLVRFNASGDFFNQAYFDAWLMVAQQHPDWIIYGYSKMLQLWVNRLAMIPANFKIVASRGGSHDHLIDQYGLRSVRVVMSEREAKRKWKLPIDHDDTHAWNFDKDFAVVIHGTQPAGSKASKAWYKIFKHGKGGYKSDYFGYKKRVKVPKHNRKGGVPVVSVPVGLFPKMSVTQFKPVAVTVKNKAGKIVIHPPMKDTADAIYA